jgi:hypothetical protein
MNPKIKQKLSQKSKSENLGDGERLPASEAWDRFERAIDVGMTTPPMHRTPKKKRGKRS